MKFSYREGISYGSGLCIAELNRMRYLHYVVHRHSVGLLPRVTFFDVVKCLKPFAFDDFIYQETEISGAFHMSKFGFPLFVHWQP